MFEAALCYWHLTPEYLLNNWTEELLVLMFESRATRLKPKSTEQKLISDQALFARMSEAKKYA